VRQGVDLGVGGGIVVGEPERALQSKKSTSCGMAAYFTSLPFQVKLPW